MTPNDYKEQIAHPGKFENECPLAPYYYDILLQGGADQDFDGTAFFRVSDADRAFWQGTEWLDSVYGVAIVESEQGFVYLTCFESASDYAMAICIEGSGPYADSE